MVLHTYSDRMTTSHHTESATTPDRKSPVEGFHSAHFSDVARETAAVMTAQSAFTCINSTRFLEKNAGGFGEVRSQRALPIIHDLLSDLPIPPVKEEGGITQSQAVEVASQNYRLETTLGENFILKRYGESATTEHVEALQVVLQQLRKRGNDVPTLIPFETQGVCAERDGSLWAAFSYIEAKHHHRGSWAETKAVGKAIGKLDRDLAEISKLDPFPAALEFFKTHKPTDHWLPHGTIQEDRFDTILDEIKQKFQHDQYYDLIVNAEADIRYAFKVRDVFARLGEGTERSVQFIHGDLHPQNILVTERGVAFIDFDLLMPRSIYTELGCALYHAARAGVVHHVRNFGMGSDEEIEGIIRGHGRVFLEQWRSEFPECEAIGPRLVARPLNDALRRVIYFLDQHYLKGVDTWSFDIPAHIRGPREMLEILPLFCPECSLPERGV